VAYNSFDVIIELINSLDGYENKIIGKTLNNGDERHLR
jgi:hypothetical protein